MAADESWSTDKRPGGARPPDRSVAPRPQMPKRSDPLPPDPRRSPRGMDEAIARLSAQLQRTGTTAAESDRKFRFDFRTHRSAKPPETEDEIDTIASGDLPELDAAVAGMEALQSAIDRRWVTDAPSSEAAPVPAPGATADAQLEAIRQRLAELSGGRTAEMPEPAERPQRSLPATPQMTEPPQSRSAFGTSVIENHLARLAGEVSMLGQRRAPADPELLSRIGELRDLVTGNNAGAEIERLEQRIAVVSQRVEALSGAMLRPENLAEIIRRIDVASAQIGELASAQDRPISALESLAREIALLRREVAAITQRRPDNAGLEAQIAALAGRIDAIGQNGGVPMLAKLEAQVAAMAARLDESRTVAAPARAAERPQAPATQSATAAPTASPGTAGAENLLIMALKEDLLRLQAGRAAGPAPTQPAPRPTPRRIETPVPTAEPNWQKRTPDTQEPPRRQPESAIEDHRPLEPGSGRPAQRPASASKSEFVAAARRAAVAAAAESEMVQPAVRQRVPPPVRGGGSELFRGKRGAAMIAAGVVAIGLAAVPVLLFSGNRDGAVVAGRDSALAPAEESIVALEDLPVAKAEAKLTEPHAAGTPDISPLPSMSIDGGAPAQDRFTVLKPEAQAVPATKDASRPSVISPESTAATPPAAGTMADPPRAASQQPVPPPPEAVGPERLRTAAATGDPAALFEVASRFAEGRGVAADPAEAAKWYRLAAERGLAIAQFRVASLYERGEGVEQSRMAGAEWYRRAAEQGNVRAMHNLAVMLSEGIGGPPDFDGASRWFVAAADHGVRDSQYNLGVMFARGLGGAQDLVQSYKWFAVAAQQGDPDAGTRRDEVAKVLSPDQLAQAQAAFRAWRALEPPSAANVPPVADDSWNGAPGPLSALDQQGLVRLIQERLIQRGFDPGPADGNPGPKTRDAVIAFQREQGVPATGKIEPSLLAALDLSAH